MVPRATHPRSDDCAESRRDGPAAWRRNDETFIGGRAANRKGKIPPKAPVLSLVERDGRVRSFHVPDVTAQTLKPIIVSHVNKATYLMTDEAPVYWSIGGQFFGHGTVNHSAEEYVRAAFWHTNTVENFF